MKKMAILLLLACIALPAVGRVTDAERHATRGSSGIAKPSARRNPLAYGYVNQDGTKASGTGNFTSDWNASSSWYEIKINNVNYFYSKYSTVVTPSGPHGALCYSDSANGMLLVRCYTTAGDPTQALFGFGTF